MARIFLSYSRVDHKFVEALALKLWLMYGHENVWFDEDLHGGDIWWEEILEQIASRDIFIYVLSNDSVQSAYCQAEFREAQRLQKQIITVLVRKRTYLNDELSDIHYIDMTNGVDDATALTKLYSSIIKRMTKVPTLALKPLWEPATPRPGKVVEKTRPTDTPDEVTATIMDDLVDTVPPQDDTSSAKSRYTPLAMYLQKLSKQDSIELTFENVEEILKVDLPPSARQQRSWWANDSVGHVQSKEWLAAGWRVANVNTSEGRVKFERSKEREQAYIQFFSELTSSIEQLVGFKIRKSSPNGANWQTIGWYKDKDNNNVAQLVFSFSRDRRFRVELYIDSGDKEYNTKILKYFGHQSLISVISSYYFDSLEEGDGTWLKVEDEDFLKKSDIPPWNLKLEYLPNRRATRIVLYRPGFINDNSDKLKIIRLTGIEMMIALKAAIEPQLKQLEIYYYG